jgi:hypothetical protein
MTTWESKAVGNAVFRQVYNWDRIRDRYGRVAISDEHAFTSAFRACLRGLASDGPKAVLNRPVPQLRGGSAGFRQRLFLETAARSTDAFRCRKTLRDARACSREGGVGMNA